MPTLSHEQQAAVHLAQRGHHAAVVARAGSGKTFTLKAIAEATAPRPAILLAFNRTIAAEARARFPSHVHATTLHALAYRRIIARDARMQRKFAAAARDDLAARLELARLEPSDPHALRHLTQLRAILNAFVTSSDRELTSRHLPAAVAIALQGSLGRVRARERSRWLVRRANDMWQRMQDPDDPAPLDHDAYLKVFALQNPVLATEFLLVDEAQDLAPVMLGLLAQQSATRLLVGDPAQRIYAFRGAVDAMAASGYPTQHLTRSFRFGEAIAEAARRVLSVREPGTILRGTDRSSWISYEKPILSQPRTVLCRTTLGVLEATLTYAEEGVHVVGGTREISSMLQSALMLWRGRTPNAARGTRRYRSTVPPANRNLPFRSWDELVAATTEATGGWRLVRTLLEEHGEGVVPLAQTLTACQIEEPDDAPVIVSTIHRAKGREWDTVVLWDDLPDVPSDLRTFRRHPEPESAESELNLLYVAVTRARVRLDASRLSAPLRRLLGGAS